MYGEILDETVDSYIARSNIYPLFVNYFNNPFMTKVKDIDNYSMYACKIHAVLGIEYRYLIAFVNKDRNNIGFQVAFSSLQWDCLQTRSMEDELKVNLHSYIPTRYKALNKKIELINKDTQKYLYKVHEFPLSITLLPRNKNSHYNSSGFIINALEEYQTILNWTN